MSGERYFVAQDRWCAVCSEPAAFVVVESHPTEQRARMLGAVCSHEHGEHIIEHAKEQDTGRDKARWN